MEQRKPSFPFFLADKGITPMRLIPNYGIPSMVAIIRNFHWRSLWKTPDNAALRVKKPVIKKKH
jgi:hypothetical protein